jgi:hypothetical protein
VQLLIYHGPEPRKPLVAIAQIEWEGATLYVGTIDLKGNPESLKELVYSCVGATFKALWGVKNPPSKIRVDEQTFCRVHPDA